MLLRVLLLLSLFVASPLLAKDSCSGKDLFAPLDEETKAKLERSVARHPYAEGRFWEVSKGGKSSLLIGTMHVGATLEDTLNDALRDRIKGARTLFVELDAAQQTEMMGRAASDPTFFLNLERGSIKGKFSPEEWQVVLDAVTPLGIPEEVAELAEPWFLYSIMSLPTCAVSNDPNAGLDGQIERLARANNVSVISLEDYQTQLNAIMGNSVDGGNDLVRSTIPFRRFDEAHYLTNHNFYDEGRIWMIFEFGKALARGVFTAEQVEQISRTTEERLLNTRNKNWMPKILPELSKGNAVVAVGALHLGGQNGLLRLLERRGYSVSRIQP